MGKVTASASAQLEAPPDRVLAFLRDYRDNRPRILTDNYTAYRVEQGGKGEGTVYAYHFAAGGRERDYRLHVHEQGSRLEEADQMSSFLGLDGDPGREARGDDRELLGRRRRDRGAVRAVVRAQGACGGSTRRCWRG